MIIDDIFDRILLRSGQFILRKAKVEIDIDSFRILVEDALAIYSNFVPYTSRITLDLNASRSFKFKSDFDPILLRAPDWISEATPVASFGSIHNVFQTNIFNGIRRPLGGELVEPIQAPWDFDKVSKVLTVSISSFYKVIAVFEHEISSKLVNGNTEYEVLTITRKDQTFFQLLQGMFLTGIGRSRRAFTLNDLPILLDGDTLVSEGTDLIEKARENMLNEQRIHLAFE